MEINSKLKTVAMTLVGFVVRAVGDRVTVQIKKQADKKLEALEKRLSPKKEKDKKEDEPTAEVLPTR